MKDALLIGAGIGATIAYQKYNKPAMKQIEKMIDKTTFRNAISTLKRFQIIETLDANLTDEESRIIIFDSILMAVRVEDIKAVYEKLEIYRKGGSTGEEADEGETD